MSKMIFDYECEKCKKIQEKWHESNEENKEPCEFCNAKPKYLKKLIGGSKCRHGSWSRWNVV